MHEEIILMVYPLKSLAGNENFVRLSLTGILLNGYNVKRPGLN